MGPETTSIFYLNLIKMARRYCDSYPSIVIDNVSFPFSLEEGIIVKSRDEELIRLLPILKESVRRLNKIGVDFIVIPCNTVHVFIEKLREVSLVPILSIVDETMKQVKTFGHKRVGLLATAKTVDNQLFELPFKENEIDIILPTKKEQDIVSRTITKILESKITGKDEERLNKIIKGLIKRGAEAVVLGCTDLQIILNKYKFPVRLLDTMKILADATFDKIKIKDENKIIGR